MDVFRLDQGTFLPDTLIEGYTSMIWTERFSDFGEFEMKTPKIEETTKLLPEGSLISLRDGTEVMFVESSTVARDSDGSAELTLTGRTFETFLENRILLSAIYRQPWVAMQQYRDSEFIALLLWNHMINTTGEDPTRPNQVIDNKTAVPNVVTSISVASPSAVKQWSLEEGQLYQRVRDFLKITTLGIRSVRPVGSSASVVTFDTSRTATRGQISYTPQSNIQKLRLDVYQGLDRTRYQTDRPSVIFHYDSGHIDSPQYLISIREHKNMVTLATSLGSADIWPNVLPPPNQNVTGLARKTLFVDGGDQGSQEQSAFLTSAYQKGYVELDNHKKAVLFDGAISLIAPYKYNKDYFLGDYVTLMGEYGFEETMQVSEYIRTQDIEGDRGYPGLHRVI